jgi:hypothetical protein
MAWATPWANVPQTQLVALLDARLDRMVSKIWYTAKTQIMLL